MTLLSSEAVRALTLAAMYPANETPEGKPPPGAMIVKGIVHSFVFDPARLTPLKSKIDALLDQMPAEFHANRGGGWSFLNFCMDNTGRQWGEHVDMEALICLGIGVGSAKWLMQDLASTLPGGVPYVEVDTRAKEGAEKR